MCNEPNDIYIPVEDPPTDQRLNDLKLYFLESFKEDPTFFVRVPGRVNIIGEHIDYCGYPVLPMAIEQDILIAAKVTNQFILQIRNTNAKYVPFEYDLHNSKDVVIKPDNNGKPFWYNYVLCGIKGALIFLDNKCKHGLQIVVDGNIPPASGLSSSSALVSAACLTFLFAHNVQITKSEISSICAKCERYIGTQGGGMDQAIAFLAEKNCAQYITWNPLIATPVTLPEGAVFVVAHSLSEANKAASNDFNQRVMECRFAAKILAVSTNTITDAKIPTLSQVQKFLQCSLDDMLSLVKNYLPKEFYTKDEIANLLDMNISELDETFLTDNTKHLNIFKLRQRATHVYEEAKRVEVFRQQCQPRCMKNGKNGVNGDYKLDSTTNDDTIKILGNLMSQSHKSLRDLYECSHDNLDRLVELSLKNNVHARLTGAGWGGCIVALCPESKVQDYVSKITKDFYENYCQSKDIKQLIFITAPSRGAVIFTDKKKIDL